jgi:hypothetical protein
MAAPNSAEWSITGVTNNGWNNNLLISFPVGVTQWAIQRRVLNTPPWTIQGPTPGTPIATAGLAGATTYEVQAAWFNGGVQVSPWGETKTVTTL